MGVRFSTSVRSELTALSKLASSVVLYVLGTSHEMTVYVRTQQILVSKKVTTNIFANRLPLILFINFISHPSDCLDKVDTKFFSQILDMCINNTFVPVEIIFPKAIQQILPGKNAPLIQK